MYEPTLTGVEQKITEKTEAAIKKVNADLRYMVLPDNTEKLRGLARQIPDDMLQEYPVETLDGQPQSHMYMEELKYYFVDGNKVVDRAVGKGLACLGVPHGTPVPEGGLKHNPFAMEIYLSVLASRYGLTAADMNKMILNNKEDEINHILVEVNQTIVFVQRMMSVSILSRLTAENGERFVSDEDIEKAKKIGRAHV